MPTYSYQCTECGNRFDAVQAFTDDALTTCDNCSGRLRKLFGSVGVVFKGSGFYHNDSRAAAKASTNGNGSAKSSASTAAKADSTSGSGSDSSAKDSGTTSAAADTSSAAAKSTASTAS